MEKQTITINGVHYDASSGLPNETAKKAASRGGHHATNIHQKTQRSSTLNRSYAKKPAGQPKSPTHATIKRKVTVSRSPHITKFAKDPQPISKPVRVMDIGPSVHPHVAKAHTKSHTKAQTKHAPVQLQHPPAKQLKEQAIAKALANAAPEKKAPKHRSPKRSRKLSVASASLAIMLLAGYLTYLNLPALSVRVAAAQAGIDASYPDYRPTGYRLNGPVAYAGGEVSMNFKANASTQQFSINQSKSSWDSSALLANYVEPKAGESYDTYSDAGLTIYTYGSNAAWVNGGILYTIEGDAALSNDQVRHIATSM